MDFNKIQRPHNVIGLVVPWELIQELGLDSATLLPIIYETVEETLPNQDYVVTYDEISKDYIILVSYEAWAEKVKRGLLKYLIAKVSGTFTDLKYLAIEKLVYIQTTLN